MTARRLDDWNPLPAELKLALGVGTGLIVEIGDGTLPPDPPPEDRKIRASFLRALILGQIPECSMHEKGVQVRGAYIAGDGPESADTLGLDLEGCDLRFDLVLFSCRFPELLLLRSASLRNLYLAGSHFGGGIDADHLEAKGGIFLRRLVSHGEIKLGGARLGGHLECEEGTIVQPRSDWAFCADHLQAQGSVYLRRMRSDSEVRLYAAKLGGALDFTGAHLSAGKTGRALAADRLEADGGVILTGVVTNGDTRIFGAKIGGDISCAGARFTAGVEGHALGLDGCAVRGNVIFYGSEMRGEVRLHSGRVSGNLACDGASFIAGENGKALNCDGVRVEGSFFLRKGARVDGRLVLTAAHIGVMNDEPGSWPQRRGDLLLDRCHYSAFTGNSPVDAVSRIRWLELSPRSNDDQFQPQPWEQAARVLRDMGHGSAARDILIEKEKRQRAARRARVLADVESYGSPRFVWFWLWLWDTIVAGTVRYGRMPLLAVVWLLLPLTFGFGVFWAAQAQDAIKPNLPLIQRAPEWVLCGAGAHERVPLAAGATRAGFRQAGESRVECFHRQAEGAGHPRFNPYVYSADALIPVVSLEMQSYWIPDDSVPFGAFARFYLWVHIVAGWFLTLLAVAGLSGLIKTDNTK